MPEPIAPRTRSAALFDVDRTLLPGSALFPLAAELARGGLIPRWLLPLLALDHLRYVRYGSERPAALARARRASLRVVAGRRRDDVVALAARVVERVVRPRLYPQALALIEAHRDAGHLVILASSGPQDYVEILAEVIGADGALGTRAEVAEGVYTGRLIGDPAHGPEKASRVWSLAVERRIHLRSSIAYSDSISDLPLLELVGNPVAVNPSRALARVARSRDWPILRFPAPSRAGPSPAEILEDVPLLDRPGTG
jgi:HAD superfamily hydrolase (TIGR01490 family)